MPAESLANKLKLIALEGAVAAYQKGDHVLAARFSDIAAELDEPAVPKFDSATESPRQPNQTTHFGSDRAAKVAERSSKIPARRYPDFSVEDDQLVLVGWQKKSAKEYVQRIDHNTFLAILKAIKQSCSAGGWVFASDDLRRRVSEDIPVYKINLVVRFLRAQRIATRKSRSTYRVQRDQFLKLQEESALGFADVTKAFSLNPSWADLDDEGDD